MLIKRFNQRKEIDYFDMYALVSKIASIRVLIAVASIHGLIMHQMDVKTAFLNGDRVDEIYVE